MNIRIFISICFSFLMLGTCKTLQKNDSILAVNATAVFPEINFSTGKLIGYDTSVVSIYYYQNLELYKIRSVRDSINSGYKTLTKIKTTRIFVRKIDSNKGIVYNLNNDNLGTVIAFDSLFKNAWYIKNRLYPIFGEENNITLMSVYKSKNLDTLKEIHSIKSNKYKNQSAIVFSEYVSSLNNINFSLSRELDSIKHMKLYKIQIVRDQMKINDTLTFDKYETNYNLERLSEFDKKEIKNYIEKFQSEKL